MIQGFIKHIEKCKIIGLDLNKIPQKYHELESLTSFFDIAKENGTYISALNNPSITSRATLLNRNGITPNVRLNDCFIAATAEWYQYYLVTCD